MRQLFNDLAALLLLFVGTGAVRAEAPFEMTVLPFLGDKHLVELRPGQLIPGSPIIPASTSVGLPPIAPHERAALSADAAAVVASNTRFGLDIYHELSAVSKPNENVLISPFSISAALAMTYAGAGGRTAQQMSDVLRFTIPSSQVHPAFGELLRDLTAHRSGYQLDIANRLFAQQRYPFETAFKNITGTDYGAPLEEVDFVKDTEGSRRRINEWVENQTNDKIRDLLPSGSVKDNTRLVLTNAIYFDGSWKNKFDKSFTHDETFFAASGTPSTVAMMHQQQAFRYAERPGYQMLELPYAGDDLSLVVMLPNSRDGLDNVEASLTPDEWSAGLDAMYQTSVNVSLPKFTFDSSFKLVDALKALGMTDAFDKERADLKRIADPASESLYIDDALHKAFIDVNEEGTEAAAATAIIVGAVSTCFCAPPQPKTFDADHPFLFALRDVHTGSLLFLGRVADPGKLTAFSAAVPEPSASVMLVIALVAGWSFRRRSN
jgi:serpin B